MVLALSFWILAVAGVVAALAVVVLRDVFRAALSLIMCFLAIAGIYITLSADFLAAAQIVIYIGGISVLILLAIMLTRVIQRGSLTSRLHIPAIVVAVLFLGVMVFALINTPWQISAAPPVEPTTAALANRFFAGGYLLAVEIAAAMLLSAILGAIILVREK